MTQHDIELEYKRYHSQYDDLDEIETAPRWVMVTVWSAVLLVGLLFLTGLILAFLSWMPLSWRV